MEELQASAQTNEKGSFLKKLSKGGGTSGKTAIQVICCDFYIDACD